VQQIAADSMNTKEWRMITERLKYDDRIQILLLWFPLGEDLCQPRDG